MNALLKEVMNMLRKLQGAIDLGSALLGKIAPDPRALLAVRQDSAKSDLACLSLGGTNLASTAVWTVRTDRRGNQSMQARGQSRDRQYQKQTADLMTFWLCRPNSGIIKTVGATIMATCLIAINSRSTIR